MAQAYEVREVSRFKVGASRRSSHQVHRFGQIEVDETGAPLAESVVVAFDFAVVAAGTIAEGNLADETGLGEIVQGIVDCRVTDGRQPVTGGGKDLVSGRIWASREPTSSMPPAAASCNSARLREYVFSTGFDNSKSKTRKGEQGQPTLGGFLATALWYNPRPFLCLAVAMERIGGGIRYTQQEQDRMKR